MSVGSYSTTSTCTFTYEVYDTVTSAASTLPFTVTSTSNTVSLEITPGSFTSGTYNLKMYVTLFGTLKNEAYIFTVVVLNECHSPSITVTNPTVPTTNFDCYETEACSIPIGTYAMSTSVCVFTYSVIDTGTGVASTLGFTIIDSSNTISLNLNPATGSSGTYNLKIQVDF